MNITNRKKRQIEDAWFSGTASDSEKTGIFIALTDNVIAQFLCYDELHSVVEVQLQRVSVRRGFEGIIERHFATSPDEAVSIIENTEGK
jgi:hypothetical protein